MQSGMDSKYERMELNLKIYISVMDDIKKQTGEQCVVSLKCLWIESSSNH